MRLQSPNILAILSAAESARVWIKAHLALLAGIALSAAVPLWLLEHDARLRREFELGQLRQQAAAQIADLRARAVAAVRDADSSARRIQDLEARRQRLEREEADLRSEISQLQEKERARLQEAAALPFPALAQELRRELGPGSFGNRESGLETRELPVVSSQLPEKAADGTRSPNDSKLQIQDSRSPNPQFRVPNPESRVPNPELLLTEPGARAVAAALVERDACREQSHAQDGLLANCRGQAAAGRAVIEEMNRSLAGLKEALRLKDEIQARTEAVHRAELKAVRGGRLKRFGRALEYVGAGVVIGVVVAQ
jgi:hypothetical protein